MVKMEKSQERKNFTKAEDSCDQNTDTMTVRLLDVNGRKHPYPLTKEYLLKEEKDVFTGIGCFPGESFLIDVDGGALLVQHPARRISVLPQ